MIIDNRKSKLIFQIFSLLCIIAIGVCAICDFAINKTITWSGYAIVSTLFAWIVTLPLLLAHKNKFVLTATAATILIIPYLYLLELFTPVHNWAASLGTPIAITGIAALWITYLLIKFVKINKWYLSSVLILLYGVIASTIIQYFVNNYLNLGFFELDNMINLFSSLVIAILVAIIGYNRKQNIKEKSEVGNNSEPEK